MKKQIVFFLFCLPIFLNANNIQVSNISLSDQDVNANTLLVNFDLSWENSWRISGGPANWDAAWVFLKYRVAGAPWNHIKINYVNGINDGHQAPSNATINTSSDQMGCFIYKSTEGAGQSNFNGLKLLWNYGAESLEDDALIEIKVFAVEMVYVPQNSFYVGNRYLSSEFNRFFRAPNFFSSAYFVASENAITVGTNTGNLYYNVEQGSTGGDQQGPVPVQFPKGYEAFYCMKYEASQGQYVAFFNTLTDVQKPNRDLSNAAHKNSDEIIARNGFSWESGFATTVHPDVPVNYIGTDDSFAYLDWAGLRPMTELEYEKSCRGPLPAVNNEFAWGNGEAPDLPVKYSFLNLGTANELVANKGPEEAGITFAGTVTNLGGPLRCGIHAASAINKNRTESGGSYYGIMELSGNLYERVVSIGTSDGRGFTGQHGNGVLTSNGSGNVSDWPLLTTGGIGYRGGSYANNAEFVRMADRFDAANSSNLINSRIGFRGVRTAE